MVSPHLKIEHVADTAQKAPVVNEQTDLLDRAMNQFVVIDVSAGGQIVITEAQAKQNVLLRLVGAPGGTVELVMPADERLIALQNQTSDNSIITVGVAVTAGTWETLVALERAIFHIDGENAFKIASTASDTVGIVEQFVGMLEVPEEKTYTLDQSAAYAYDIDTVIGITALGSLDIQIEIDGTPVTGLDPVAMGTGEATGTATAARSVAVGQTVTMIVSDLETATAEDFSFTMKVTRT